MTHLYCMALSDWHNALFCAVASSIPGNIYINFLKWKLQTVIISICLATEKLYSEHTKDDINIENPKL